MLEKYRDNQNEFYKFVQSAINNNKMSHAYFIETSYFSGSNELVLDFVKFLFCHNKTEEESKKICNMIENGTYDNFFVVEPDGIWIKKEQIMDLKDKMSTKSYDNNIRVYLIKQADKLNPASANSMLKFLEEPEENIVGILVSDNRYKIINTLLSRCQIITLKSDNNVDEDQEKINDVFDFIMNVERKGIETICYTNQLLHDKYKTKEEYSNCFSLMKKIYFDIINYNYFKKLIFSLNIKDIEFVLNNNTIDNLIKKVLIIEDVEKNILYNANLSLLIDKFIIDLVNGGEESEENSYS